MYAVAVEIVDLLAIAVVDAVGVRTADAHANATQFDGGRVERDPRQCDGVAYNKYKALNSKLGMMSIWCGFFMYVFSCFSFRHWGLSALCILHHSLGFLSLLDGRIPQSTVPAR